MLRGLLRHLLDSKYCAGTIFSGVDSKYSMTGYENLPGSTTKTRFKGQVNIPQIQFAASTWRDIQNYLPIFNMLKGNLGSRFVCIHNNVWCHIVVNYPFVKRTQQIGLVRCHLHNNLQGIVNFTFLISQ